MVIESKKEDFVMMNTNCQNCQNCQLSDYASQPSASRFLSQAYPIMSATMRSSSAAARQKCLKVNTSV